MHANKRILTNGSFKDGVEIQTNGSLHGALAVPKFISPNFVNFKKIHLALNAFINKKKGLEKAVKGFPRQG